MTRRRQKTSVRGVYSLGGGRYEVVAHFMDPKTGRPRKLVRIVRARSVADAARQREELRAEALRGAAPRRRVRLSTYVESWLLRKLAAWKTSTATQAASVIEVWIKPALGDYYLDAIEVSDVVAWRDEMARTPVDPDAEPLRYPSRASVNSRLRLLRQILGDAGHDHGLPNPAARVEPLRAVYVDPEQRDYYLDAAEARAVLGWLREHRPRWYPLVELLALTGLRFGEATALRWTDVDLERGLLHVRRAHVRTVVDSVKSEAGHRVVPVVDPLAETLAAWRDAQREQLAQRDPPELLRPTALVFPSSVGRPHHTSVMHKPMRDACLALGLPWERIPASKIWRRVFNNLLRQVASEVVRQELVGHADEAVGRRHYSRASEDEKREAAGAVLRLVRGDEG